MAMYKKPFTVDVDTELSEKFSLQVDERAYTKYRAVEGAIRAFMALEPKLQVQLMNNKIEDVYAMLVRGLVETEIRKHLDELGPAKEKFLALLKQAKEKKSPKR